MDDLVEWYTEQLDADTRLVREQRCINCGNTTVPIRSEVGVTGYTHGPNSASTDETSWEGQRCPGSLTGATPVQDSDRFLREVEAKRTVLKQWEEAAAAWRTMAAIDDWPDEGRARLERAGYSQAMGALWVAVATSALVYEDRPGFKESWRP